MRVLVMLREVAASSSPSRHTGEGRYPEKPIDSRDAAIPPLLVIPAKAGIQKNATWMLQLRAA